MSVRSLPIRGLAAAIVLAALAACSDERSTGPAGPGRNTSPAIGDTVPADELVPAPAPGAVRAHEADFIQLAQQVPGFAGYVFEGGTRVVYLTDLTQQAKAAAALDASPTARAAMERAGSHEEGRRTGTTVYVQARYDFPTLRSFRDRAAEPVLNVAGTVFADLDERRNRIVVAIEHDGVRPAVEQQLSALRVPLAAVVFEITAPLRETQGPKTLRDYSWPLEGGYQIQNSSSLTCTLGFVVVRNGVRGFVTNSHCTSITWKGDGISFHQNVVGNALVGRESSDPRGWPCGIRTCRWSDAAVVQINGSSIPSSLGSIARTLFWGFGIGSPGSIEVDLFAPTMQITAKRPFPNVGDIVDKMGRTAGWTSGEVTRTCVDTNVNSGGLRRVLCQDFANYTAASGDSGSPVFVYFNDTVELQGIHWGQDVTTSEAVFSSVWNIEGDLGVLTVY